MPASPFLSLLLVPLALCRHLLVVGARQPLLLLPNAAVAAGAPARWFWFLMGYLQWLVAAVEGALAEILHLLAQEAREGSHLVQAHAGAVEEPLRALGVVQGAAAIVGFKALGQPVARALLLVEVHI